MKKIISVLLIAVLLLPTLGCQTNNNPQRAEMLDYLKLTCDTLNDLPQASQYANPSKDLSAVNTQVSVVLSQNIGKYQDGLQRTKNEKVPDIADAKTVHETGVSLVSDTLSILQKMKTALDAGNQAAWTQSVDDYTALLPRVSSFYRLIESLLSKYNISDTEVNYKFRGK
jgi:hypothetical protein